MRSGHRTAHPWVVVASAILAACALVFGWIARSQRPVPEALAGPAGAADAAAHGETSRGGAS